jgi:hypothetical protein
MQWLAHIAAFCSGLAFAAVVVSSWMTHTFGRYRTSLAGLTAVVLDKSVSMDHRVERISVLSPALMGSGLILLFKLAVLVVACVMPLAVINAIGSAGGLVLHVSVTQLVAMTVGATAYALYVKRRF